MPAVKMQDGQSRVNLYRHELKMIDKALDLLHHLTILQPLVSEYEAAFDSLSEVRDLWRADEKGHLGEQQAETEESTAHE